MQILIKILWGALFVQLYLPNGRLQRSKVVEATWERIHTEHFSIALAREYEDEDNSVITSGKILLWCSGGRGREKLDARTRSRHTLGENRTTAILHSAQAANGATSDERDTATKIDIQPRIEQCIQITLFPNVPNVRS